MKNKLEKYKKQIELLESQVKKLTEENNQLYEMNEKFRKTLLKWTEDTKVAENFLEILSEQRTEYFKSEDIQHQQEKEKNQQKYEKCPKNLQYLIPLAEMVQKFSFSEEYSRFPSFYQKLVDVHTFNTYRKNSMDIETKNIHFN